MTLISFWSHRVRNSLYLTLCIIGLLHLYTLRDTLRLCASTPFPTQHWQNSEASNTTIDKSAHSLPIEYSLVQQEAEDPFCSRYSAEYIHDFTAPSHRRNYCTSSSSRSNLECLHNTRSRPEKPDRICVARKVSFEPGAGMRLACDVVQESVIEKFKSSMYDTGPGVQLKQWRMHDQQENECRGEEDGKYTMLVKREGGANFWHTLMEIFSAQLTLDILTSAGILSSQDEVQILMQDERELGATGELWTMLTGHAPKRLRDVKEPACLSNVILPMPGASNPFWDSHWEPISCSAPSPLLATFVWRIKKFLSVTAPVPEARGSQKLQMTIIDRKESRRIVDLAEHVSSLERRFPNVTITVADMRKYTLREQIELVQRSDILLGAHGAGLTNLFFLPPRATVVEVMPPGIKEVGFRNAAKIMDLNYFSTHGISEDEHRREQAKALGGKASNEERNSGWQDTDVFLSEESWLRLFDVAIASQGNRGRLALDVR